MDLKTATLLALTGALLATILLIFGLIGDIVGVLRGFIAPVQLFKSLIDTFAGVTVTVFLLVFYRERP